MSRLTMDDEYENEMPNIEDYTVISKQSDFNSNANPKSRAPRSQAIKHYGVTNMSLPHVIDL